MRQITPPFLNCLYQLFCNSNEKSHNPTGYTEAAHFYLSKHWLVKSGASKRFLTRIKRSGPPPKKKEGEKQLNYFQNCRVTILLDLLTYSIQVVPGLKGRVTKFMLDKFTWPQISSYVTITGAFQENDICRGEVKTAHPTRQLVCLFRVSPGCWMRSRHHCALCLSQTTKSRSSVW